MTHPERHPGADVIVLRPKTTPPVQTRPRIKKLRLASLLSGLGLLALISAAFGSLMAVAADLPSLTRLAVPDQNSLVQDRMGRPLGVLTGAQNRILVSEAQIPGVMEHAIIAIEDRRFYTNRGVDLRGTARALYQDVVAGRAVQGGSTITQQFVKNATAAQDDRSVRNKVREAALAFHVSRKWGKREILRNYLNSIYFGNGAYGVEAAARTYFAFNHLGCEKDKARPCTAQLEPAEAALLSGVVASPSAYDPLAHPAASRRRRDLVLTRMREQGYLDPVQYQLARSTPIPNEQQVQPPVEDTRYPYFTSWVKQQVVDELGGGQVGARRAFEGGLRIRTTIDSKLQDAAETAVGKWLGGPPGPEAALIALDNKTGEVRAMVGGPRGAYNSRPFNLATQGRRQPGSAFKPFVLAQALKAGISPASVWSSSKQEIPVPNSSEKFVVNNYEDSYNGPTTLAHATTVSDNSVFAQVGIKVGTRRVATLSRRMGIRTKVSSNYAMTLGGLREGVTPLDLAHAYLTFASGGELVYGSLSPNADDYRGGVRNVPAPPGIDSIAKRGSSDTAAVKLPSGGRARNVRRARRILPEGVARQTEGILSTVVKQGTGKAADLGPGQFAAGKTGTTENYSDAWFVGWTKRYTVAVWVGYPDGFKPMRTEWRGEPVAGGTFPANIWRDFVKGALAAYPAKPKDGSKALDEVAGTPAPDGAEATAPAPVTPAPSAPAATPAPAATTTPAPAQPAPKAPAPKATPAPATPPATPPSTSSTGGGTAPGGGTP